MERLPTAELTHALPGRARVAVRERAGDAEFFEALERAMLAVQRVNAARANPRTGSLLILHAGALEPILGQLGRSGLVALSPRRPPDHGAMSRIAAALDATDVRLGLATRGELNLNELSFYVMLGASAFQFSRGNFLPAGMTLFFYSVEALQRSALRERVRAQFSGSDTPQASRN